MELFVIRHAIAEPLGKENEFSDEKRALTAEGGNRMREVVKGLVKLGVEFDLILTSPLVRAVETAEIVCTAAGLAKKDIKQSGNLAPGASAEHLFAEIKGLAGVEAIALIGHQPDLGGLISRIIQSDAGAISIQLKKGSVCCLNVTETVPTLRGDLVWLLTPRQLRLVAKA
jgi:phosphohistidine phosphatase